MSNKLKKCKKCGKMRPLKDFCKDKTTKDGLLRWCKICVKTYDKNHYQKNKDKILKRKKIYSKENKEKISKYMKIYGDLHKDEKKIYNKKYRKLNIVKLKEHDKLYRQLHKKELNKKALIYQRKKRKIDINYRLKCYIRRRINLALETHSKRSKVLKLLGCSIEFLKSYLESKFQTGMTWKNHSQFGWHIDHIRPCCTFDLSKPKEQRKCFHYTNLQPLWWQANIRKGHKYEK